MEAQLRELRAALGERAFDAAFASGRRLTHDEAIELALAAEAETTASAVRPAVEPDVHDVLGHL